MNPGHQAIARPGAEPRPDVEAGRHGEEGESPGEHDALLPGHRLLRNEPEAELGARADEEHIEDRADPRPLLEGDPEQQHERADEVRHEPERQPGLPGDPLPEHIPGRDADAGAHHEPERDAVEDEPDEQLRPAPGPIRGVGRLACGHVASQGRNWTAIKMPILGIWRRVAG